MRRIQRAILRPFTITGWGVMSFAIFFLSLGVSKIFEASKLVLTGKFRYYIIVNIIVNMLQQCYNCILLKFIVTIL